MIKSLSGTYTRRLLGIVLSFLSLFMVISPQPAFAAATNLYASPAGSGTTCSLAAPCSLTGAQDKVRTLNTGTMTGDIIVNLRAGTYNLASTFQLTEADSGNSGYKVIYQNYAGEVPTISGGAQITGWTLHDSANNIWQASVSSRFRFRQLYVNGMREIRARTPNLTDENTRGPYYWATNGMSGTSTSSPYTFGVAPSELASWNNLNAVEVVMLDHWMHKRARIASFSGGTVSFLSPERTNTIMIGNKDPNTPHYYENAYEFIDAEGEWYLDTTTNIVYYKPRSGENMSTANVIAPNVENLVTITGASSTNMAHDIRLTGITFQYSNWTLPSNRGYLNYQAGYQLSGGALSTVPGAIQLANANNISIDHNTFQHTGAHGILALDVTQNSIIDHNIITDTSGGGIYLGLVSSNSSNDQVTYNLVTYGGMDYTDTVGIFLEFAPYAVVNHNEVGYYRYTGISAGFQWDDATTAATNIEIGYNYIHNVMLLHDDGAAIYTLGKIPNMNIHDNYMNGIFCSDYSGGSSDAGIYLDQGSTQKTVQTNVLDTLDYSFFSKNTPNYGNRFQNNYYNSPFGIIANTNTVTGNTSVSGSSWPSGALTVMNNSGNTVGAKATPSPSPAPSATPGPTPVPDPNAFITSQSLSATLRKDYIGTVGMKFTTGATDVVVTKLGRWVASGNAKTHMVKMVNASTGADVALVHLETPGKPAGGFTYVTLDAPVTLAANTSYYLVGSERGGGGCSNADQWYDYDTSVATTSAATVNYPVYWNGSAYAAGSSVANTTFGPLNFIYAPNAALSKSASASSTWGTNYDAGKGNDGNNGSGWSPAATDTSPWWQVDLGAAYKISQIQLVTRQSIDQPDTRRNFEIRASNDPSFATYTVLGSQGSTSLPYQSTFTANVTNNNTFRYIRAAKTINEYFYIAELNVYSPPNIASSMTATASSVWGANYDAGKGNDGSTGNGWSPVATDTSPWWQVDLGAAYQLSQIQLVTRQTVDQPDTRRNFEIRASNDPSFATYTVLGSQGSTSLPYQSTFTANVSNTNSFRYIRAAKTINEYFFISELLVFNH